jgi:putative heme-binding domain-containing protein
VRPDYLTYVVITKGGENLVGVVTDENATTITLRQANGNESVYPRTNIESMTPQAWSIMPEGFEERLSPQAMADLMEYVAPPPP